MQKIIVEDWNNYKHGLVVDIIDPHLPAKNKSSGRFVTFTAILKHLKANEIGMIPIRAQSMLRTYEGDYEEVIQHWSLEHWIAEGDVKEALEEIINTDEGRTETPKAAEGFGIDPIFNLLANISRPQN